MSPKVNSDPLIVSATKPLIPEIVCSATDLGVGTKKDGVARAAGQEVLGVLKEKTCVIVSLLRLTHTESGFFGE